MEIKETLDKVEKFGSIRTGSLIFFITLVIIFVFGMVPLSVINFVIKLFNWDIENTKNLAEILGQIYVGFGAFIAGLGFAYKVYSETKSSKK